MGPNSFTRTENLDFFSEQSKDYRKYVSLLHFL